MAFDGDRANARLTIDVAAVVENWSRLRDRCTHADCAAVVKADAYGLGAAVIAPALAKAGCRRFFVAQLDEGIRLRAILAGTDVSIMVLGGVLPGTETLYGQHRLVPVLNHLGELALWRRYASDVGDAQPAWVHLDTGMNRLGLGPDEQTRLIDDPAAHLTGIALAGWLSHLACADEADHPSNPLQLERFRRLVSALPSAPASFANSSGIFRGTDYHFDLARPGVALYGANPTPERHNPMLPAVRIDARVLQVRSVDSPMTVGYGAGHAIVRRGRLATLSVGYADGYLRSLSGKGAAYFNGLAAPVVGRVSMDLITVDVTDVPEPLVQTGAWAELIGPHRTVDQVAAEAGTIGYEVLTSFGPRYLRVYV